MDLNNLAKKYLINTWQNYWDKSTTGRFYYDINKTVQLKPRFCHDNRYPETILSRLRLGRCYLNDYKFMINRHENGLCDFCHTKEDVEHYLLKCIEFISFQDDIIQEMIAKNTKITVKNLLKDDKFEEKIMNYVIKTRKSL